MKLGVKDMQKIDLEGKVVLVTGAAGFIGSNLVIELLRLLMISRSLVSTI